MNTAFISERSPQDSGSMSTLLCLCLPRSLGISLNLNPASIFQKLIPCWLQHLQIFFFFIPQAVFSVLFMVAFALQILLSLTRSHWTQFIFVFVSMTLGDRSKNIYCCALCQRVFYLYFPIGSCFTGLQVFNSF